MIRLISEILVFQDFMDWSLELAFPISPFYRKFLLSYEKSGIGGFGLSVKSLLNAKVNLSTFFQAICRHVRVHGVVEFVIDVVVVVVVVSFVASDVTVIVLRAFERDGGGVVVAGSG